MPDELIDTYDENGHKTGSILRNEAHRLGLWHDAIHVWVFNHKKELLLQKRSKDLTTFPGLWDISLAGHIQSGQTPKEATVRELKEELGLSLFPDSLHLIAIQRVTQKMTGWINRQRNNIFVTILAKDVRADCFEEVEEIRWVSPEKFSSMISDPKVLAEFLPRGEYYSDVLKLVQEKGLFKKVVTGRQGAVSLPSIEVVYPATTP